MSWLIRSRIRSYFFGVSSETPPILTGVASTPAAARLSRSARAWGNERSCPKRMPMVFMAEIPSLVWFCGVRRGGAIMSRGSGRGPGSLLGEVAGLESLQVRKERLLLEDVERLQAFAGERQQLREPLVGEGPPLGRRLDLDEGAR